MGAPGSSWELLGAPGPDAGLGQLGTGPELRAARLSPCLSFQSLDGFLKCKQLHKALKGLKGPLRA